MARVFISHSSRDSAAAARLKDWLGEQGFDTPFLDFDKHAGIPPGADWERTLYRELNRSEAVVIVQTPNWLDSKWCFAEFTQARALGKPIFPVIVEDTGSQMITPDIQTVDLLADRESGLDRLARALTRVALDSHGGFEWDSTRPPYPGLLAFQEEDAPIYFGRDDDIRRMIERLNTRRTLGGAPLLALLGASGSGKSSLLRAGVIPRLRRAGREWIVLPTLRPQARPMTELAQSLAVASGHDWRQIAEGLSGREVAQTLNDLVVDLRIKEDAPDAQILLPIDQAEELFGASDAQDSARFLQVLSTALSPDTPMIAIMCMRSDFLGNLQSSENLRVRFEEFSIGPLPVARIPQIIEGPARVAGLTVEDAFVQQAAMDAETEDALPLLAFALRELYDRAGGDKHLSLADYRAMGDPDAGLTALENAVRRAADTVIAQTQPDAATLTALRESFVPAMVRVNDQGDYVRRPAAWSDLPARAHDLLERLAKARLLVISQDGDARMIEVAHEAMLRKWPRLRSWLDEAREFLAGRQQLEIDLADWHSATDQDKPAALLTGLKLSRARGWLSEHPHQLSDTERAFIKASIDHADAEERQRQQEQKRRLRDAEALAEANRRTARRTRIGMLIASFLACVALGAGIFAYTKQIEAVAQAAEAQRQSAEAGRQRDAAEIRQSQLLATLAAQENVRENHTNAILLSVAALEGVDADKRAGLTNAKKQLYDAMAKLRERRVLTGHTDRITFAAFDAAGTRLVTASHDNTARIWDVETGAELALLSGHGDRVTHAAFSPDGRWVATGSEDGTARLWDAATGAERHILRGSDRNDSAVYHLAFSPDSTRLVTAASWSGAVVWEVETGGRLFDLNVPADRRNNYLVVHVKFSPDGTRIAMSDRMSGWGTLWDGETGALIADLKGHDGGHFSIAFSPDGQQIVTASADQTARVYDGTDGHPLAVLSGHTGKVFHAEFNGDGTLIVTASADQTARIWATDGTLLRELRGHTDEIRHAAFVPLGPDGRPPTQEPKDTVVTVGRDDLAFVWDAGSGHLMGRLTGHLADVTHVAFSPDGRWTATTGDQSARLWQLDNSDLVTVLTGHTGSLKTVAYSPDGQRLLSSSGGLFTVRNEWAFLWDTRAGSLLASFYARDMQDAVFSPDGTQIAVGSRSKIVIADGHTGNIIRQFDDTEGRLAKLAFSPDGKSLAASYSGTGGFVGLKIWNVETGDVIAKHGSGTSRSDIAWSPDGRLINLGAGGLYDVERRRITKAIVRTNRWSNQKAADFSPDGRLVLSAHKNVARIWDASTASTRAELKGHSDQILSARFSHDGTHVLTTSKDMTAKVWDAETGALRLTFKGHTDQVNHGAFSPDDSLIVTGSGTQSFYQGRRDNESKDSRALVWDAQTGAVVAELEGHNLQIRHVAFSPNGDQVATASEDRTARLWDLVTGAEALIAKARSMVPRDLTPAERARFGLGD